MIPLLATRICYPSRDLERFLHLIVMTWHFSASMAFTFSSFDEGAVFKTAWNFGGTQEEARGSE